MRVWIINPFDELPNEPGRPGRYWSLCQVLADQGHELTWWTADFSHRRKQRRVAAAAPSRPPQGAFRIQLVPVTRYRANVGRARLRSHRVFGRNLERLARMDATQHWRPDRIVASWPPVEGGEVAVRLGREWGVPVTIDVMDAWPEAFAAFIPGPRWVGDWILAPWRRRARAVFAASERVSGVGRAFLDYAHSLGAPGPTHLAYLGAWFGQEISPTEHTEDTERRDDSRATDVSHGQNAHATPSPSTPQILAPSTSPLRLLYLGNVGRSQDLDTVVAGVALARRRGHDVRLEVAGGGERWAELERAVATADLGDAVRLSGFVSGAELEAVIARAQVGVNPVRGESLIACPYKVADYLAAGMPVLNSLPGELADLLAEYGAGRQFEVGSPESFVAAIEAWAREPGAVAQMSRGARRLGEAWFAREKTYPALAKFVVGG